MINILERFMPTIASTEHAIKTQIKAGYVLHLDFDWILLTYGDVTTGMPPSGNIGARYGMCIGVEGEATFWVSLTTQDGDNKQRVPEEAKLGAWAGNGHISYFPTDQVWVMTRDMAFDSYKQRNLVKSTFKHSYVTPAKIESWPSIPVRYPKNFTPLARMAPAKSILPPPPPVPEPVLVVETELPLGTPLAPPPIAEVQVPVLDPDGACERLVAAPILAGDGDERNGQPVDATAPLAESTREINIVKGNKILANRRFTDEEIAELVIALEAHAIRILFGGMP
jgi:hypothetical protein